MGMGKGMVSQEADLLMLCYKRTSKPLAVL